MDPEPARPVETTRVRRAAEVGCIAALGVVAFIVASGGGRALTQGYATWLGLVLPFAIGGALAGAASARLGRSFGAWTWLLGPASLAWAFGVGFIVGWEPIHCAGPVPWVVSFPLLALGHAGWAAPLASRLDRGGWWRTGIHACVGVPAGVALLATFYVGWGRWSHGEFVCGGEYGG